MLLTWVFTVFSETNSSPASSRLLSPRPSSRSTSSSRGVSSSVPGGGRPRDTSPITVDATWGASTTPPLWTVRTAASRSAGAASFIT